jgi:putative sigma-54 modulation protein|mmetsp:Transcript_24188/g.78200  ORF Transcript_24188/g.78200 Transcript_24188/m.78200 type:complete len:235 (+) Transcript_24188:59-763(+)
MSPTMRAAVVASLLGVAAALQSHLPHARPVRGRRSRHAPSMVLSDGAISTVSANNLKMTDSMRDYVEDKIGTVISKFAGVAQRCDTHLSVMRNPAVSDSDVAEVVVFCKGEVVRAEERSPSMYSSIDLVADKVARKLRKVKERKEGKRSKPKLKVSLAEAIEATALEEEPPLFDATTLIRKKKYPMPEQSLVDAMVCMDGLDHDFYMFKSEETGQINVIYKRKEGGLGLIEPDE